MFVNTEWNGYLPVVNVWTTCAGKFNRNCIVIPSECIPYGKFEARLLLVISCKGFGSSKFVIIPKTYVS